MTEMKGLLGGLDDSMNIFTKLRLGVLLLACGLAVKATRDLLDHVHSVSDNVALLLTSLVIAIAAGTTALGEHRRHWQWLRRRPPTEF